MIWLWLKNHWAPRQQQQQNMHESTERNKIYPFQLTLEKPPISCIFARALANHTHIFMSAIYPSVSLWVWVCVCVCVFGLLFYARHQVMGVAKAWQNLMKNYEIYLSFRRQRCVQHFTPIWWPSLLVKYMSMDIYILDMCTYATLSTAIYTYQYIYGTHIYTYKHT